eukprot:gene8589-biopygen12147
MTVRFCCTVLPPYVVCLILQVLVVYGQLRKSGGILAVPTVVLHDDGYLVARGEPSWTQRTRSSLHAHAIGSEAHSSQHRIRRSPQVTRSKKRSALASLSGYPVGRARHCSLATAVGGSFLSLRLKMPGKPFWWATPRAHTWRVGP